eukprot:3517699-Rhodomonas_salina.2
MAVGTASARSNNIHASNALLTGSWRRAIQDYQISRGAWMFDMNVCANTNTIPAVCQGPDRRPAPGYQTLYAHPSLPTFHPINPHIIPSLLSDLWCHDPLKPDESGWSVRRSQSQGRRACVLCDGEREHRRVVAAGRKQARGWREAHIQRRDKM